MATTHLPKQSPLPVSAYVRETFANLKQGITKDYDKLLQYLAEGTVDDRYFYNLLKQLQENLVDLGNDKENMVGLILKIHWLERNPKVIHEYQSFVISLLSAHTFYLKACLRMIVSHFMPRLASADDPVSVTRSASDSQSFLYLHQLLKTVIKLVPAAPTLLIQLCIEKFPYHSKPLYLQQCFVQNLLQLSKYLPSHRMQILELIIDKMTKLDVQCPRESILENDDLDSDDNDMDIFEMDGISTAMQKVKPETAVQQKAEILDTWMEQMFCYLRDVCLPDGSNLDWQVTRGLYRDLLTVFDKIILPTHGCGHVQYVMYYICSFKDALSEGFLDYLWKKVQSPNVPAVYRQAAVAYIGSFLARAEFIPVSTVKAMLDLLVPWVHAYIQRTAETSTRADVRCHGPFYSVCQGIFYIFAFRHKNLLAMEKGLKFCQGLNLQTIVTSRLNPLRFCLPTIVSIFASVARQHQLAFCDTIIEKNKRSLQPVMDCQHGQYSQLTRQNPLDSFFPFDPYVLKNSSAFIHPMYREYDGIPVAEETGSQEDEEEDYMDVGSFSNHHGPKASDITSSMSIAKSPVSPACKDFFVYGISPGFKST